jgi:hypothetical protein
MMFWFLFAATSVQPSFPERTPVMIEACIYEALETNEVSETNDSYKYICAGNAAQDLWNYLEDAKIKSWEQTTENGVWLSREFPLGGCFKRTRNVDGSPAVDGRSCTIWIPRPVQRKP